MQSPIGENIRYQLLLNIRNELGRKVGDNIASKTLFFSGINIHNKILSYIEDKTLIDIWIDDIIETETSGQLFQKIKADIETNLEKFRIN